MTLRVLVVDDDRVSLRLAKGVLEGFGHEVRACSDGLSAIESFERERPDVILMDVQMPGMSGIAAAAEIRRLSGDDWLPLIFLSASADRESVLAAFEAGGDDYIFKPFDPAVLNARLQAFERVVELKRTLFERNIEFGIYHEGVQREQELAKHVMARLVGSDRAAPYGFHRWLRPASNFSGDATLLERGPGGVQHVILADACGKGLAAALSIYPIIEYFRTMTHLGHGIEAIATRLNEYLWRYLPRGRFVAVSMIAIDHLAKTIRVWNGGSPSVVLVSDEGHLLYRWRPAHPALGVLPPDRFDPTAQVYPYQTSGTIVSWTDGLVELIGSQEHFDEEPILNLLCGTRSVEPDGSDRCARLVEAMHARRAAEDDDIALVALRCDLSAGSALTALLPQTETPPEVIDEALPARWGFSLRLGPRELRSVDPVPTLLGWLGQLNLPQATRSSLFVVVTELLTNAIDHGVLELDSSIKDAPDGFEAYARVRHERLHRVPPGAEVHLELEAFEDDSIAIRVRDTGSGFNFMGPSTPAGLATVPRRRGRGISLVRTLCASLHYEGCGNRVEARLQLGLGGLADVGTGVARRAASGSDCELFSEPSAA